MSLITRCPACETMFKVVPDQLRISEGWVRCGQCSEIFNASQHLLTDDAPAVPPVAATRPSHPPVPAFDAPATPFPSGPTPAGRTPVAPPDPVADLPPAAPVPIGAAPVEAPADAPAAPHQEPRWADPVAEDAAAPAPAPVFVLPAGLADGSAPSPFDDPWQQHAAPAPEAAVSFMRAEPTDAFWRRRPVRLVLVVLAIALAAALAAQVLLQERNRIVQFQPAARPVLAALCAMARCDIGPLRQIESIVIDSSSFGRLRADNYRLGFSLRNTSALDVEMPAIELSLTDTQDQALIRRVILPAEFGASAAALAAGSDWSSTLALYVRPAPHTERIAGYRLLAFYP